MRILRHILLLLFCLALVAGLGHWLPARLGLDVAQVLPAQWVAPSAPPPEPLLATPPVDFAAELQSSLGVLKMGKRRNGQVWWMLGKGTALPVYLLKAQRAIESAGGRVHRMIELNSAQPTARLTWSVPPGDSSTVEFTIGDSYRDSASQLAIAFAVRQFDIATLEGLSSLDIPYTLLMPPFDTSQALYFDMDKLKRPETLIWLPMEPHNYPYVNPGTGTLFIHHTPQDIRSILQEAWRRLPAAVGIATRHGERAVEHRPLLEAITRALPTGKSILMDLTGSRFSKLPEVCRSRHLPCLEFAYRPDRGAAQILQTALANARRTGQSIAVLPANAESARALMTAVPAARAQGTEFVTISTIANQSE